MLDFHICQHLENHQNEIQLHHLASISSVPVNQLYKHIVSGIKPITTFTSPGESTGDTASIWTLFSHTRSLCNCYQIAYASRTGDILLLFLLVPNCQISVPNLTTKIYVIYYCGWWCRGSTLLQMQWQGQTAHKTLQESWPAYGAKTYMNRYLTEATDAIISSSYMWTIGTHFQNPGNTDMYIMSVVRLRIRPDIATPAGIDRCTLNDNSHFTQLKNNSTYYLWRSMHMWHAPTHQRTHALSLNWTIKIHSNPFHDDTCNSYIYEDTIPTTASFHSLHLDHHLY